MYLPLLTFSFFFFNDTATTEIYTLSLHDALPISSCAPWTTSLALELHVGDLDLGEPLPMPGVAPVPRAPGEPVNLDLLALAVSHDLGRHLRPLEHRLPGLDMLPVTREQDALERDLRPRLGGEARHLDREHGLGLGLAAAVAKDGRRPGGRTLVGT